jgi:hypothetical protein
MVNNSTFVVGMYIPDKIGGTLNCIKHIMKLCKPFCIINPDTLTIAEYIWNARYKKYDVYTTEANKTPTLIF